MMKKILCTTMLVLTIYHNEKASYYNTKQRSEKHRQAQSLRKQQQMSYQNKYTQSKNTSSSATSASSNYLNQNFSITLTYNTKGLIYGLNNKSETLNFTAPFTTNHTTEGLTLEVAIYPNSTAMPGKDQIYNYLIVGLLYSSDHEVIARIYQQVNMDYPPNTLTINYDQPISKNYDLFTMNKNLSGQENHMLFQKETPVRKKYLIIQENSDLVVKES